MGLFDDLRVKMLLPNWPSDIPVRESFQTKDLDCCMQVYKIDEEGQLWLEKMDGERQDDPAAWLEWKWVNVTYEWIKQDLTTTINFYDSFSTSDYEKFSSGWIEYRAVITEGKVSKIELVEYRPTRPWTEEELAEHEEMKKKNEEIRFKYKENQVDALKQEINRLEPEEKVEIFEYLTSQIEKDNVE